MKKYLACCGLAACLNLFLLTCNLAAQTANAGESVRFRLVRDYLIVVSVQVNGVGTFDFLLDTGTNTTLITPELATQLNLRPADRIEMVTIAGAVLAPRVWLPRLDLGSRSTENIEALITDLPELRQLDTHICGVIGQNFLARFNYLLDYRKQRIEFIDRDENQLRGTRLPVEQDEGRLLLATQSTKPNQPVLKLVLDTAISGLILSESSYRKLGNETEPRAEASIQISTNVGSANSRSGILRQLQFGNESLAHLSAVLLQSQTATLDRSIDGLLPTCLFHTIFFNNQGGYVILNPHQPR